MYRSYIAFAGGLTGWLAGFIAAGVVDQGLILSVWLPVSVGGALVGFLLGWGFGKGRPRMH